MKDEAFYQQRREQLAARYLAQPTAEPPSVQTDGVDHLALICSNLEATIEFYSEMLGMQLTRIVPNRDEPTSTHIFFDMGGGNQLAFFDFPNHGRFGAIVQRLKQHEVEHSLHGSTQAGSVYLRDPDGILVEVTTGY